MADKRRKEVKGSLILSRTEGIGPARFKKLIEIYDSAYQVLSKGRASLEQVVPGNVVKKILKAKEKSHDEVDKELESLAEKGGRVIPYSSEKYPKLLREISNPPMNLFVSGSLEERDEKGIAIVGTRAVSEYGKHVTKKLARGLSEQGFTIVSGFASGADSVAHKAALENGGRTVAVFAGGIDYVYPPTNRDLYASLKEDGAIVSEIPIGTKPEPHFFPRRNRIIAGLTLGTLVTEAPEESGALITADRALEQNREVFATPGNINSPKSTGTNNLIKQGAKLVQDVSDVIDEFPFQLISQKREKKIDEAVSNITDNEKKLYKLVDFSPKHIDELTKKSGMSSSRVMSNLLSLELKGLVKQLPGNSYIKL